MSTLRAVTPEHVARAAELTAKLAGLPRECTFRGLWIQRHRRPPIGDPVLGHVRQASPGGSIPDEAWFGLALAENPNALTGLEKAELVQIRNAAGPPGSWEPPTESLLESVR